MRVLIVHNDYGKPSGEESVVERVAAMFAAGGHEVEQLRRSTAGCRDSLGGKLKAFVGGVWSPSGRRAMAEALDRFRPDVVNVHNLYPFIGPAALEECRKRGVPVVMTVHNFRLICPTGLFMLGGRPCEECLRRGNEWGCVSHNCEGSMPKSVAYAARNALARVRGHYSRCVTHFACITDFQRSKLIEAGFDADRISVIPNSVDYDPALAASPAANGDYVAYCGRLSYEKGYDRLMATARRHPEIEFRFAGAEREPGGAALPPNVRMMGFLRGGELQRFFAGARFVVMPSRCYEGFPMAILEAAQHARPTIGPDHGGFTEIIGKGEEACGLLFDPASDAGLDATVATLWRDPELATALGVAARRKLAERYSTAAVARQWEALLHKLKK